MSLVPARRAGELWLIQCFTGVLLLYWRAEVDANGTLSMIVVAGGPAASKEQVAEMFDEEEEDGAADASSSSVAMLLAATRWAVSVDLSKYQRGR